jgi:phosphohistidine phosphatase
MTRRVGLLRHAKSDWPPGVPDHDRPLAERGRRDAAVAGRVLRERLEVPDLVLVSTALRARQTWDLVHAEFTHPPHHRDEPRVYDASVDDLLLLIREVPDSVERLVVIGHNPGLEELAFALSGPASDPSAVAAMSTKFPTCGLAVLAVDRPWAHVVPEVAVLESFDVARG